MAKISLDLLLKEFLDTFSDEQFLEKQKKTFGKYMNEKYLFKDKKLTSMNKMDTLNHIKNNYLKK